MISARNRPSGLTVSLIVYDDDVYLNMNVLYSKMWRIKTQYLKITENEVSIYFQKDL